MFGQHMCPSDGYVCFRNSQLLSGRLSKAIVGAQHMLFIQCTAVHCDTVFTYCDTVSTL